MLSHVIEIRFHLLSYKLVSSSCNVICRWKLTLQIFQVDRYICLIFKCYSIYCAYIHSLTHCYPLLYLHGYFIIFLFPLYYFQCGCGWWCDFNFWYWPWDGWKRWKFYSEVVFNFPWTVLCLLFLNKFAWGLWVTRVQGKSLGRNGEKSFAKNPISSFHMTRELQRKAKGQIPQYVSYCWNPFLSKMPLKFCSGYYNGLIDGWFFIL